MAQVQSMIADKMGKMLTKTEKKVEGMAYFIQPIMLEIRLIQLTKISPTKPNIDLEVHLKEFSITLSKKQYEAIFKLMEYMQKYLKFHQKW